MELETRAEACGHDICAASLMMTVFSIPVLLVSGPAIIEFHAANGRQSLIEIMLVMYACANTDTGTGPRT